jgi:hypothetical protein
MTSIFERIFCDAFVIAAMSTVLNTDSEGG